MKTLPLNLICLACVLLVSDATARPKGDAAASCGREMAEDAEVPAKLGMLLRHVASNMLAHATWVGASPAGERERDALRKVATEYLAMADAAGRAAQAMEAMWEIPGAPHDPQGLDRQAQIAWMRKKIDLQGDFIRLLTQHAQQSKKVLAAMAAGPSKR